MKTEEVTFHLDLAKPFDLYSSPNNQEIFEFRYISEPIYSFIFGVLHKDGTTSDIYCHASKLKHWKFLRNVKN